ncbi:unnamed protein product [Absidia cylindrospora]
MTAVNDTGCNHLVTHSTWTNQLLENENREDFVSALPRRSTAGFIQGLVRHSKHTSNISSNGYSPAGKIISILVGLPMTQRND